MSREAPKLIGDPSGVRYRCYDIIWDDAPDDLDDRLDVFVPRDVTEQDNTDNAEIADYLGDALSNTTGFCHTGFNFEKWHENLDAPGWDDFENWYRTNYSDSPDPEEDGDMFRAFTAGRSSVTQPESPANGDSFDPGRSFDSPSEAINYANAQRCPMEAAKEIIARNIDHTAYGFASEVCAMLDEVRADAALPAFFEFCASQAGIMVQHGFAKAYMAHDVREWLRSNHNDCDVVLRLTESKETLQLTVDLT